MSKQSIPSVTVVGLLVLLASGCAGSTASSPGGGGARTSATAVTPTASGTSPAASSTPVAPEMLKAARLQAALLPASAFGPGLTTVDGYPRSSDEYDGNPALHEGCLGIAQPMADLATGLGSQSHAIVLAQAPTGQGSLVVTEQADQFQPGDAATMMRNLVKHIDTDCGSFKHAGGSDTLQTIATKESAVAGLGDQAVRIEVTTKSGATNDLTQVLWVRYGDVVIGISYDSADIARARSFDLTVQAKQIAENLKLP